MGLLDIMVIGGVVTLAVAVILIFFQLFKLILEPLWWAKDE